MHSLKEVLVALAKESAGVHPQSLSVQARILKSQGM